MYEPDCKILLANWIIYTQMIESIHTPFASQEVPLFECKGSGQQNTGQVPFQQKRCGWTGLMPKYHNRREQVRIACDRLA